MELNKIQESDYLDIVFEGRNQAYGAYDIRKNYGKNVRRAIVFGGCLFFAALTLPFLAFTHRSTATEKTITYIPRVLPKPKQEEKKKKPELPKKEEQKMIEKAPVEVKTVIFKPPVVTIDLDVVTTPPKIEDFADATAGQKTQNGSSSGTALPETPKKTTGGFAPPIVVEEAKEKPDTTVVIAVEQRPEFPGGEKALMQYLADNIHYPTIAKQMSMESKLYLRFVVERDGSITNIKVLRGGGYGFEEEANRVVSKMPKWSPGKQNGRNVRVAFTLPIIFHLE